MENTATAVGEARPNPSGHPDAPSTIPHTHVHTLVRRTLEHLQDVVAALLMVLLLALALQTLWRLARLALSEAAPTNQMLSEVIFVLILKSAT